MIFGYTLAQVSKAAVAALALVGAVLQLILSGYDPSFTTALIALVGPITGVIVVFTASKVSAADTSKAVAQLQAAALTVVSYFVVVPTSTVEKITLLAGALLSAYFVWRVPNADS